MSTARRESGSSREVRIPIGNTVLEGEITVPDRATGLVIFAHGSGSGRHSRRNQFVARSIQADGLATLLMDLLTREEERVDELTRHLRFNIRLLADRLSAAVGYVATLEDARDLGIGFFGASTGAAAALVAAAELGDQVGAVVSRGGRPDLAGPTLARVTSPTLLLVGGRDNVVIELNEWAYEQLHREKEIIIIPGATHLFEEPGALEQVARLAAQWFKKHLSPQPSR